MQVLRPGSKSEHIKFFHESALVFCRAGFEDLNALVALESDCFDESRRDTRATIRRGLRNPRQETWVLKNEISVVASIILRVGRGTMRIFSIATHPAYRGWGIGNELVRWAFRRAKECGCQNVSLEVDASNERLISWYASFGFVPIEFLEDYYEEGKHAKKMKRPVDIDPHR